MKNLTNFSFSLDHPVHPGKAIYHNFLNIYHVLFINLNVIVQSKIVHFLKCHGGVWWYLVLHLKQLGSNWLTEIGPVWSDRLSFISYIFFFHESVLYIIQQFGFFCVLSSQRYLRFFQSKFLTRVVERIRYLHLNESFRSLSGKVGF